VGAVYASGRLLEVGAAVRVPPVILAVLTDAVLAPNGAPRQPAALGLGLGPLGAGGLRDLGQSSGLPEGTAEEGPRGQGAVVEDRDLWL